MQFHQTILPNGLKVITIPMVDNPAVTVLVTVETGSKYETKEISGLSHFLEHMVFKGTSKRPKSIDISRELESLGAQYNAFTSQEYTGYYAKVSPEHIDTALDVVSDIYLNPLLNEKEIEKEKGVIVEEIKMYQDMPHRNIHNIFLELVYGDQPAGWNIAGNEQTVRSFTREHFVNYIKDHYVTEATTVIVSGSFDEKSIIEKVSKYFANISTEKKSKKILTKEVQSEPAIALKFKETDQAHLVLGVRTFDAKNKYDPAITMLSAVLGKGMSSRLFQKLREEMGVGYYVNAYNDTYTDHGIFTISAGVDVSRIEEVIKTLIDECKKLIDEPVSEHELRMVKDSIKGGFLLGLETSDARAEYVAIANILKGEVKTPIEEIEEMEKVTVEDIQNIAKMIFVDEKLNLAIIGPYKDDNKFKKILTFK